MHVCKKKKKAGAGSRASLSLVRPSRKRSSRPMSSVSWWAARWPACATASRTWCSTPHASQRAAGSGCATQPSGSAGWTTRHGITSTGAWGCRSIWPTGPAPLCAQTTGGPTIPARWSAHFSARAPVPCLCPSCATRPLNCQRSIPLRASFAASTRRHARRCVTGASATRRR